MSAASGDLCPGLTGKPIIKKPMACCCQHMHTTTVTFEHNNIDERAHRVYDVLMQ